MPKIAALVEGHTEVHFINATFSKPHIQRPFPNGRDVSLSLIAECIAESVEFISGEVDEIIVILDRECRKISTEEMRSQIIDMVKKLGCKREISIGITDRHFENWILADEKKIQEKFSSIEYEYSGDGTFGKAQLEKISGFEMSPTDKALLLKACSATRGSSTSPSLKQWIDSINCDWYWKRS
ncbi:hypothetical protein [Caulobacter flavus]|uniref:hypothetical protein n=1 Tax=Caulobacter flavus TaxID=1679497 RepID=UPI0011AFC786|nr:hypothetical protein [Caulobacter flavus]